MAIIGNSIVLAYPRYRKGAPVTVTKRKGFEGRTNRKKNNKESVLIPGVVPGSPG